jgi:hypothetical protein
MPLCNAFRIVVCNRTNYRPTTAIIKSTATATTTTPVSSYLHLSCCYRSLHLLLLQPIVLFLLYNCYAKSSPLSLSLSLALALAHTVVSLTSVHFLLQHQNNTTWFVKQVPLLCHVPMNSICFNLSWSYGYHCRPALVSGCQDGGRHNAWQWLEWRMLRIGQIPVRS